MVSGVWIDELTPEGKVRGSHKARLRRQYNEFAKLNIDCPRCRATKGKVCRDMPQGYLHKERLTLGILLKDAGPNGWR